MPPKESIGDGARERNGKRPRSSAADDFDGAVVAAVAAASAALDSIDARQRQLHRRQAAAQQQILQLHQRQAAAQQQILQLQRQQEQMLGEQQRLWQEQQRFLQVLRGGEGGGGGGGGVKGGGGAARARKRHDGEEDWDDEGSSDDGGGSGSSSGDESDSDFGERGSSRGGRRRREPVVAGNGNGGNAAKPLRFPWKDKSAALGGATATPHDVFVDAVEHVLDNAPASFGAVRVLARMRSDGRGVDLSGLDTHKVKSHLLCWKETALAPPGPGAPESAVVAVQREADLARRATEASAERARSSRKSSYRGVTLRPGEMYEARLTTLVAARRHAASTSSPLPREISLGRYADEVEAARAHDVELIRTRTAAGAQGLTNFPIRDYLDGQGRWLVQPPPPKPSVAAAVAALAASMTEDLEGEGAEEEETANA